MSIFDRTYVVLKGNLTEDPQTRYISTGSPVTNFTLADNSVSNSQDDNKAEFHRCVFWGGDGERLATEGQKGSFVVATGFLKTNVWEDRDGNKKYNKELNVVSVAVLTKKRERDDDMIGHGDGNIPF